MANIASGPRQSHTEAARAAKAKGHAVRGRKTAAALAEEAETVVAHTEAVVAPAKTVAAEAETSAAQAETSPTEAETMSQQVDSAVAQNETRKAQGEISTRPHASDPDQTDPDKEARFHIFVIDTGWNSVASRVLRDNFGLIRDLNSDDKVFVVGRDMSIALLRQYPLQVGRDPIITVHDTQAIHRHRIHHTHGFRLHLGILVSEDQVLGALQMFARFLATHRSAKDLEKVVRKNLHREGLAGAIEIMGGAEHAKMIGH